MKLVLRWKVLSDVVRQHEWTRGAELGIWKGQTLFFLLDHSPSLQMIGVDYWPTSEPHEKNQDLGLSTWYPPEVIQGHRTRVLETAKNYPDRLKIIEADTVEAAAQVEDGSLDFAFIDGDHSEQGVLRDISAWRSKVRPGGWLMGHDRQWGSVGRALKQAFPQGVKEFQDNIWGCPVD